MQTQTRLISAPLQTERLSNGRRLLLRDLIVEVDGEEFTIPAGETTDFSTIPWFGRAMIKWSRVDIAGVVHDWLYRTRKESRARADRIWRLCAVAGDHHANSFQAWSGWLALRLFGWIAWWKLRDEKPNYMHKEKA